MLIAHTQEDHKEEREREREKEEGKKGEEEERKEKGDRRGKGESRQKGLSQCDYPQGFLGSEVAHQDWNFQARLKFSSEIENFKRKLEIFKRSSEIGFFSFRWASIAGTACARVLKSVPGSPCIGRHAGLRRWRGRQREATLGGTHMRGPPPLTTPMTSHTCPSPCSLPSPPPQLIEVFKRDWKFQAKTWNFQAFKRDWFFSRFGPSGQRAQRSKKFNLARNFQSWRLDFPTKPDTAKLRIWTLRFWFFSSFGPSGDSRPAILESGRFAIRDSVPRRSAGVTMPC